MRKPPTSPPPSPAARTKPARRPDGTVRLLLAGAGLMGREHLEATAGLQPVRYTGVFDPAPGRAAALAAAFALPAFTDLNEAVKAAAPDALDVCVPTPFHRPLIEYCAARGLHALCEKPIALTLADAEAIRAAADRAGIRVMIAQVIRFWPEYAYALDAARSGSLGAVRACLARRLSAPPAWNTWMTTERGGGAGIDLQIHDVDFVLALLGPPLSIQAAGQVSGGVVMSVVNRLDYASGVPVTTEASYTMPAAYPFRMYFQIEFERAVLEMDFWRPKGERLRVFPADGGAAGAPVPDAARNAYGEEIRYFAERLLDGQPFRRCPLDASIEALGWCLASQRACLSRRPERPSAP